MTDSNEQDKSPETGQSPSPGARLRAARERRGLSLVEAADALRLDQSLVEALERDDFAALGAPVFAKGHLRKYAVLTGEPVDDLLLAYHQRVGVQEAPPLLDRAGLLRAAERPPRGIPAVAILGALIIAGAAGAWWWYEQPVERPTSIGGVGSTGALAAASIEPETADTASTDKSATTATTTAAFPDQTPPAQTPATSSEAPSAAATGTGATASAASPPGTSTSAATGAGTTPAATMPVATTPAPQLTAAPSVSTPAESSPSSASGEASSAPLPGEHVLVLSFSGDSWAEVHDARGKSLYYDLGVSGSRRSLHGMPPFQIFLGRYTDVSVEMDGQARAIPADSVRGNTARFSLDRT
jgi:cytoskeleton protein RodZ